MNRDENRVTMLFGKAYLWVRVNGVLELVPALDESGNMKDETLRRLAGEKA